MKEDQIIPFIKIAKAFKDNYLWLSEPFSRGQAWIDLLLLANWAEGFFYVRGTKIELKRGQLAGSMEFLGGRWKWSRTKVKRFLKELQTEQQISLEISSIITKITIVNYNKFQDKPEKSATDCTTEIQQKYNRSTTEKHTHKKNKKKQEEKEIIPTPISESNQDESTDESLKVPLKLSDGSYCKYLVCTKVEVTKLKEYYLDQLKVPNYMDYLRKGIDALDAYLERKPDKRKEYKSHYHVLRGWILKDMKNELQQDIKLVRELNK